MATETIAINSLREMEACKRALDFLSNRFGDTVAITEENAVSCAEDIDWEWASYNLLNEDQRRLYVEACNPHWKAYIEARDKHWEAFENARSKALSDFRAGLFGADTEVCTRSLKAYEKAYNQHLKAYDEACDPHWKVYKEACAKAFVTAYYTR